MQQVPAVAWPISADPQKFGIVRAAFAPWTCSIRACRSALRSPGSPYPKDLTSLRSIARSHTAFRVNELRATLRLDHSESLAPRGGRKSSIEADNLERRRIVIGSDQHRRQLEAICRSKRMRAQQPLRCATHRRRWHYLVPAVGQLTRSGKGGLDLVSAQKLLAFASRQRRRNFDRCSPPRENFWVLL